MNYLMEKCGLNEVKLKKYKATWELRYGGRIQVSKIWHLLYDNAIIWMPRKKDKIKKLVYDQREINKIEIRAKYVLDIENDIVAAYNHGMTWNEMTRKFDISQNVIKRMLKEKRIKNKQKK